MCMGFAGYRLFATWVLGVGGRAGDAGVISGCFFSGFVVLLQVSLSPTQDTHVHASVQRAAKTDPKIWNNPI